MAAEWPACLRIIVATALLGQNLIVTTPHAIEGVLKWPLIDGSVTPNMIHYQTLLINPG